MTKHAKIDPTGLWVAQLGYDVDTAAPANLHFSPYSIMHRVSEAGQLPVGPVINPPEQWGFISNSAFATTVITYGKAYSKIPHVIVNGIDSSGRGRRNQLGYIYGVRRDGRWYVWYLPLMFLIAERTRCTVYTFPEFNTLPTISYCVLETTVE